MQTLRTAANIIGIGETVFQLRWRKAPSKISSFHPHHDDTRSLLIHVPKNGGSSLHKALYGIPPPNGHGPASAFHWRDPQKFAEYTKIAVLRDPVDRFCSGFWYQKGGGNAAGGTFWADRNLRDINNPSELIRAMANPWFRANVRSWVMFAPQVWFLRLSDGTIPMDYIGRTENMQRVSRDVSELLGRRIEIPKANASARPAREDLSEGEKRQIRDWYSEDQDLVETYPI